MVSRHGGDEFAILCEDLGDVADAELVAAHITEAVREAISLPTRSVTITASVGVAVTTDSGSSASGLLRDADAAMYCAKERGRARYELSAIRCALRQSNEWPSNRRSALQSSARSSSSGTNRFEPCRQGRRCRSAGPLASS